jgi:sugar phosphate isomerase/epimerase
VPNRSPKFRTDSAVGGSRATAPLDGSGNPLRSVRFGLVHYATFPESLSDIERFTRTLRLASIGNPWDVIELSTEVPRQWLSKGLKGVLPSSTTIYLSAGPEMLGWPDALNAASRQSRRRAVSRVRELIDTSVEFGAENLMLVSGPVAGGATSWGPLLDSLQQVCAYAASFSGSAPGISMETFETLAIQRQYVGPTPLALWLMETIRRDHPGFRLTLDLAHILQLGEDLDTTLAAARGQVHHLQLSCCVLRPGDPRWGDQHLPFGSPDAHPTFPEVSRALAAWAGGFDQQDAPAKPPVVSIEVRPPRGTDSASVHSQCVRAMSRICRGARLQRAGQHSQDLGAASQTPSRR